MNLNNIRDSKSYAVKIFFKSGHTEQIKFAAEDEMHAFSKQLEDPGPVGAADDGLIHLVLDDGTHIRICADQIYMFKSFKMTPPSSPRH